MVAPINILMPHTDSRAMHSLPWRLQPREPGKCVSMSSYNGKSICSFWGSDERHPGNFDWCTESQKEKHAIYAEHAINTFPAMQRTLIEIANMEDVPVSIAFLVEKTLRETYIEEVPPHGGK